MNPLDLPPDLIFSLILLCALAVGATWLFCTLAAMLDSPDCPTDKEIKEMLKRADEEVNDRPRVRAITKTN